MRDAARGARRLSVAALGIAIAAGFGPPSMTVLAQSADGHAIAEKFAVEADRPAKEAQQRAVAEAKKKAVAEKRKADAAKKQAAEDRVKADEADMLANARREADARREELEAQRAAEAAADEAQARLAAEADAKRRTEEESQAAAARIKAEAERAIAEAKAAADAKAAAEAKAAHEAKAAAELKAAADAKAAEERRQAEAAAREAARQQTLAREREAQRVAEEERRAKELAAAEAFRKAAEDARRNEEERQRAEARRIAEAKAAEEARRAAEAIAAARKAEEERAARAEEARREAIAAERDAENQRLADQLRAAREAHEQRAAGLTRDPSRGPTGSWNPPSPAGDAMRSPKYGELATPPHDTQPAVPPSAGRASAPSSTASVDVRGEHDIANTPVTVLLLMEPGNRGIRRRNKTADPVLCTSGGCYISNGPDAAATIMSNHRALGFGRTWGARAGACSNSLGCIFRGVEIGSLPGHLQPVDMRLIRHDRREAQMISGSSDCTSTLGRLMCRRPVQAGNYVMWIVPERLAAKLGPEALEQALHDGLPEPERAGLSN